MRRHLPLGLSYIASSGSLVASSAAQLVTFAILARALGPHEFGLFVKLAAITNVAVHVCGIGASDCLLRRVSQDRAMYPAMLGHNLILIGLTGALLVALGLAVLPFWITISPDPVVNLSALALFLITNVVLVRLTLLTDLIFLGHSRYASANRAVVGYAVARTVTAILACLVFSTASLAQWTAWQFAGNLVVVAAYAWWLRGLGRPRLTVVREEIRLGLFFCSQFVARSVRQNADLFMLGLVASIEVVGSYGVARRILDSSYLTIDALNRIAFPSFAKTSLGGIHAAMPSALRLLPVALALGLATSIGLFVVSGYLPLIFGQDYTSLTRFVGILAWLPLFIAASSIAMDVLGASSHQGERAAIVNATNLGGSLLIVWFSWWLPPNGTFAALYIIEGCTVAAAWLILLRLVRRSAARTA
ncbi:lipopolysaccharide biosynthesis protein [Methylobacterium sp. C25]|nr:lipopolysaccharide biosynthesis protein [Methylobacterium sp. C25]